MIKFLELNCVNKNLEEQFQGKLKNILSNDQYILGTEVADFEQRLSHYIGTDFALGVSNGLDAITLCLMALGVKGGDEVIVPSNTFIATWIAVTRVGAIPVPVEFNLGTYNIESSLIEEKMTKNTKAIIAVHLYGLPADMDSINEIAKRHNLNVIEDCAQAFGAEYKGKKIGSLSDIAAFSFFPTKNFGALGDAGGITMNSTCLYDKIKSLRNYGSIEKYVHNEIGLNARLDSLQAAFLNVKFDYIDEWNMQRQAIAKQYLERILSKKIKLPNIRYDQSVWHLFVILVENRDEFQDYLFSHGIETLVHYPIPPHLQESYQNIEYSNMKATEDIAEKVLSIPIYPGLSRQSVNKIINIINNYGY